MTTKLGLVVVALFVMGSAYWLSSRQVSQSQPPSLSEVENAEEVLHDASDSGEECPNEMTPALTEGPYYKTGSPARTDLIVDDDVEREVLTITGHVFDQTCELVANAWLDFWQADGNGVYDNAGFRLRGHQFTDDTGHFTLTTVVPGEYSGRTPHIHVKVRPSEKSEVVTTQLFFPGEAGNQTDAIFDQGLVLFITEASEGKLANFNFRVART